MKKTRGFTLIELLVVIAIVVFLAGFLIAALWPQKDKALRSNTQAMIQAISSALDQYYAEFHDFPPDGYDTETSWQKAGAYPPTHGPGKPGIKLGVKQYTYFGSGCLIYFLCYPVANVTMIGADQGGYDPRNVRISPCNKGSAFLTTLKKENFSVSAWDSNFDLSIGPGNPNYQATWAQGEIIDAYGWPIHYDKVGSGDPSDVGSAPGQHFQPAAFTGASGTGYGFPFTAIHSDQNYMTGTLAGRLSPPDDTEQSACPASDPSHGAGGTGGPKHGDPRAPAQPDGCFTDNPNTRPRNPGGYDLWAHGKFFANGISAITNWK